MTGFDSCEYTTLNGEHFQKLADDIRNERIHFLGEDVVKLIVQFDSGHLKLKNIPRYGLRTIYANSICNPSEGVGGCPMWNFDIPEIAHLDQHPENTPPQSLDSPAARDEKWSVMHTIWMDAPCGIALTYRDRTEQADRPWAIASFRPNPFDGNILRITQLQGVTYRNTRTYTDENGQQRVERLDSAFRSPKGLGGLDPWSGPLVAATEELAKRYDFTGVEIQRALNNACVIAGGKLFPPERARAIYDDSARRLGYTAVDEYSDFVKMLNT
ncbi:hypothetical protein FWF64_02475 [Candidatus Saccharibacteria bacterium]|nr:hypothetical protein [Candidatus Saccharibacteria bacterium]